MTDSPLGPIDLTWIETLESTMSNLDRLHAEIKACRICLDQLPLGPRPVLQLGKGARILVAAQAPGTRVHETGLPFNDPSGDRLREWMGIDRATFYDPEQLNIVPMGFCYPGRGKSGDLPPRPECAQAWRDQIMEAIGPMALTLVIGQYAQAWHLGEDQHKTLTERVRAWKDAPEGIIPLPHPSPRNNIWLRRNPWFEEEVVPEIQSRVRRILASK